MAKMARWETPVDLERSVEYGAQIIHAVTTGKPEVVFGNVMNDGLIDNLPQDACVEVACRVTEKGFNPEPYVDAMLGNAQIG